MKICAECGKELEKNIDTCTCAVEFDSKITPNPVLEMVQQIVRTKLYLLATIVFTVAVVLGFVADWVTWAGDLLNLLEEDTEYYFLGVITNIISRIGVYSGNATLLIGAMLSSGEATLIISAIPSIVLAVGMWIIYFSVNDCINYKIKPLGFKMVETILIIFAIFTCLNMAGNVAFFGVGLMALIVEIFTGNFEVFKGIDSEILFTGFVLFVSLLFQIAVARFYSNMYGLVNSIRTSVEKRTVNTMRPTWGIVALAIGGLSIILSIASSFIINKYPSNMLIPNIVSASATILFGLFLLSVRTKMNSFVEIHRSV